MKKDGLPNLQGIDLTEINTAEDAIEALKKINKKQQ